MNLLQRCILLIIIVIINGKLYNNSQWEFWVITVGMGIFISPPFKKKKR